MIELVDHPRHRVLRAAKISLRGSAAVREGISSRRHEVPDFTIVRLISLFIKFVDALVGCALIGWLMALIFAVIFEIADGGLDRAAKYGRKEVRGSVFKDFEMGAGRSRPVAIWLNGSTEIKGIKRNEKNSKDHDGGGVEAVAVESSK